MHNYEHITTLSSKLAKTLTYDYNLQDLKDFLNTEEGLFCERIYHRIQCISDNIEYPFHRGNLNYAHKTKKNIH